MSPPLFLLLGLIVVVEAQRSGVLPSTQRVKWRGHSGLFDGKANGVDLVGGYYDAEDNVKFRLPMAFTVTMMSWSIVEYGKQIGASGELGHDKSSLICFTSNFVAIGGIYATLLSIAAKLQTTRSDFDTQISVQV